jgi:hypothetical protein
MLDFGALTQLPRNKKPERVFSRSGFCLDQSKLLVHRLHNHLYELCVTQPTSLSRALPLPPARSLCSPVDLTSGVFPLAVGGFDHGFSLRRDPEAVDGRLVPKGLTVFLHLEPNLWAEAHAFSVASRSYFVGTKFHPPISTPSS